jgi:hypothetical protein
MSMTRWLFYSEQRSFVHSHRLLSQFQPHSEKAYHPLTSFMDVELWPS